MEKYKKEQWMTKKNWKKKFKKGGDLKFKITFISTLCVHCIPSQLMDLFQFPNQACQSKVSWHGFELLVLEILEGKIKNFKMVTG